MAEIDEHYIQAMDHEEIKGNYDIKEYIGKGEYGCVYEAVHHLEEKKCALKLIKIKREVWESRDDKVTKKIDKILEYKTEVMTMVNLWETMPYCEHVVKYDYSFKLTGLDIIVIKMELCNQSLFSYLKSQTAQNSVFDDIAFGLINGLDYIHKKILFHGDIKSDNIFMVGDVPKIGDFGNASLKKKDNGMASADIQDDDLKEMGIVLVEVYVPDAVSFKGHEEDKKMKRLSTWKESRFVEDTKLSRNFVAALIEDLYNNRITASEAFRRINGELKIKGDNQDGKKVATSVGMVDSLGNLNLHDKASPTSKNKVTPKKVDKLKCSLWHSVGKLYFTDTAGVRSTQIVIAVGNRFVITAYASGARHEMEVHFDQSKYLVVDNRYCYPKVNHQIMLLEVGGSRVFPIPVRDFIEPQECAEFYVFGLNGDGEYASCESKILPEQSKDDTIFFESDIKTMGSPLLLGVPKDHKRPEVVAMLTSSNPKTSNENFAPGHMSFEVREGTIINRMLKEILSEDPKLYEELSLAN